jgi:C_GCAxxG_C_C family probable redox protein
MEHKFIAAELFTSGCNCAQAVFVAFCDKTGIDKETALKLSSSFGGGMGKLREVCGSCTGAFAVAGALWGYSDVTDHKLKSKHYELVRRISDEFKEKNETIICRELLEGIKNTKGKDPAKRDAEYYATRPCCKFVMDACDIIDAIIKEKEAEHEAENRPEYAEIK